LVLITGFMLISGCSSTKPYTLDPIKTFNPDTTDIPQPPKNESYQYWDRIDNTIFHQLEKPFNPWKTISVQNHIPHPSVGYFRADVFNPGQWVSAHPLPAYENMTLRDSFWGAKQVMSFSDEDIRAIVETGQLSNPEAEEYLTEVLIKRRDKIGHYWFIRINPIDKFKVTKSNGELLLSFSDLGIEGTLFQPDNTHYDYDVSVVNGENILQEQRSEQPQLTVKSNEVPESNNNEQPAVLKFEIVTRRATADVSEKTTRVYVAFEASGPRVVGIQREE
jgi:hypothetical protein